MAITRIHHVGLVTGDLENARHVLVEGFGLSLNEHRTPWPDGVTGYDGTTILEFPIGEMYYEIAKPGSADSAPGQFLESSNGRGGMYYVSFASDDLAGDIKEFQEKGIKIQGEWDGEGPVFLDPTTTLGIRLQVTTDDTYYVHPYYRGNGTCTGMAHIGLAGRDGNESREFWTNVFGLREDFSSERGKDGPAADRDLSRAASDPVHILEFPVGGTVVEISHPTTTESGTARLVAERATLGNVFHHTAPFTPDVHRFVDSANAAGMQQIGSIPPKEVSERATGWFHPRTCMGMLLEPWNRPPGHDHVEHTHGAHPGP